MAKLPQGRGKRGRNDITWARNDREGSGLRYSAPNYLTVEVCGFLFVQESMRMLYPTPDASGLMGGFGGISPPA